MLYHKIKIYGLVVCLCAGAPVVMPALGQPCTWYQDADADGFGDPSVTVTGLCDTSPAGFVANQLDCNDAAPNGAIWYALNSEVYALSGVTPVVAISADTIPFIMFVSGPGTPVPNAVWVMAYDRDAGTWQVNGDGGFTGTVGSAESVTMALDDNTPYVSYADASNQLAVMEFTGGGTTGWEPVGTIAGTSSVTYTDLELYNSEPYVVHNINTDLYVKRFSAGAWQNVGGVSVGAGAYPQLAADDAGTLYTAFADYGQAGRLTVRMWDGVSWADVGSAGISSDFAAPVRLTVDAAGVPWVAYFDYGTSEVIVRQFVSGSWVTVGTAISLFDAPGSLSLSVDGGVPHLAYSYLSLDDFSLHYAVKEFAGDWQDVVSGPVEREDGASISGDQVALSVAPDGIPYIVFRDFDNSDYVSVMQVGAVSCPLPVTLLYFNAGTPGREGVLLEWATATEINFDHFELQRSANGHDFLTIGHVPGEGNAREGSAYTFTDRTPLTGKNYYRLRSVDIDGTAAYSAKVMATVRDPGPFTVYPNPNNGLRIFYKRSFEGVSGDQVCIVNSLGMEVYRAPANPLENKIEFATRLSPGSYMLRYYSASGEHTARFAVL